MGDRWYALTANPGKEAVLVKRLKERGWASFCPVIRKEVVAKGVKTYKDRPIYNGYVFVMMDVDENGWVAARYVCLLYTSEAADE